MLLEEWKPDCKILDLGTGAGLPGIPLKILNKNLEITLVDSLNKRVEFLKSIISILELNDTTVIHARAEELGRINSYREKYDIVVSRAVARLPILLEYCLPFLKDNSYFMAYKGPDADDEIRESRNALAVLGGEITRVIRHELPDNGGSRCIILVRKSGQISSTYPRKPGIPEKRPL
jgi:16S rRNA (guanine527-N7)-methyltransferase